MRTGDRTRSLRPDRVRATLLPSATELARPIVVTTSGGQAFTVQGPTRDALIWRMVSLLVVLLGLQVMGQVVFCMRSVYRKEGWSIADGRMHFGINEFLKMCSEPGDAIHGYIST